jgi:hypothetical protein
MRTFEDCGHVAEVSTMILRERLPPHGFVKQIGPLFRCLACGHKGADVDARHALGHYG